MSLVRLLAIWRSGEGKTFPARCNLVKERLGRREGERERRGLGGRSSENVQVSAHVVTTRHAEVTKLSPANSQPPCECPQRQVCAALSRAAGFYSSPYTTTVT